MKNIPLLDPRKAEDILKNISQKAYTYVPEWKYEPDSMDGGAALAELFSFMFGETLDRLNRVPYKHFIEFLNILEVSAQSMAPATGMASFELAEGCDVSVPVKKGTQMYCDLTGEQVQGDVNRVIFETERDFIATPAKITGIYSVDPRRDIIEKLDFEQAPARFFNPDPDRNLQRHCFSLAHKDVLKVTSPVDIVLSFENTTLGYLNEEGVSQLADPVFTRWTYFDGNRQMPFDRIYTKDGRLHLIKDNDVPIVAQKQAEGEDGGRLWVYCDMLSDGKIDEIVMNRIHMGSAYLYREKHGTHIKPDWIYANDIALDTGEAGYCFGKQPMAYDCFYISSDEVFSKRDARVNIEFEIKTVVREIGTAQDSPQYNFYRKYIVEKADIPAAAADDIFISRIIWEYWNGSGWTHLRVEGDLNPFNGKEGSFKKRISFLCPGDIEKSLQNSIEGYWIRARVVEVENAFSMYAHFLLPYIEAISLDFDYMESIKPAERVYTENNCVKALYSFQNDSTAMSLFQPMSEKEHAVYFAFDRPPAGYPVNLYVKTEGQSKSKRTLSFEYLTQDVKEEGIWCEVKVNDRTENLEEDGILSIYAPKNFRKSVLFGQEGYWLRIADKNLKYMDKADSYPLVQKIIPNVVEIIQKQTVLKEMFRTGIFESGKVITLANHPVLDCQLWVNEISDISKPEMTYLMENYQDGIDILYDNSGHMSEFWVKWEGCESFINSQADSRHFQLDRQTGKITFGNGRNGKVPSAGKNANIRVDYCFGGGKKGNLPAGKIEGLVVNLPYVDKVTNLEMTCGGSEQHDIKTLERVGPQRLRHRGRAVTALDFESIVVERFPEIKDVKCVANYNRDGQLAWGYVTLVVMPYDIENRSYSLKISKKIEQFLSDKVSCELQAAGRFSVVPAIVMKVSATVSMSVNEYENAAETENQVVDALKDYLNPSGSHCLKIEELPVASDLFGLLKRIGNVSVVHEIILEGCYYEGNKLKIVPLDAQFRMKYIVVTSGEHIVKII